MVTTLKLRENKMDNRGSKSKGYDGYPFVKEQRVDGSLFIKSYLMNLRCILQGSERNRGLNLGFNLQQGLNSYIKNPSKQFGLKKFSLDSSTIINPGV